MKFALKLVFSVMIIVCILFSISGILFVKQNFNHALSVTTEQNADQHMLQKYTLESNMLGFILNGETYTDEKLSAYTSRLTDFAGGIQKYLGVFQKDSVCIYSNLPAFSTKTISKAIKLNEKSCLTKKVRDKTYMLFASSLDIKGSSATIISAYDISNLFIERDRQNHNFMILNGILVLVSGALIGFLAWLLTRPIVRLNRVSNKIASGSYSERTNIKSHDEIGELSKSFDKMVAAVEENIQQLQTSIQQRDDFISAFSHEIKTPMTSIIGFSDILRTEVVDSSKQFKYASIIYSDAKRLETLSLKLIDLMELSNETFNLLPLSIDKLISKIEKQTSTFLGDVTLSIKLPPAIVLADETLLDCLLSNLISNAKKAEPKDNCIHIQGAILENNYRITVSDKGFGISQKEITRIMEPFYMVDKSRSRTEGGSGLGLSLCQKIATLHQTNLSFDSCLGEGTSVSFDLHIIEKGGKNI